MTHEQILAAQAAYAARPFAVRWRDSHFSTCERFSSYDEAFAYVQQMWALIRHTVRVSRNHESLLWQSSLETPAGRVQLNYVLLADDVSSYRR